jgi:hypothetical protein
MAKLYGDRQLDYVYSIDQEAYTRYAIEKRAFQKGLPNTIESQGTRRSLALEPDSNEWDSDE